MTTDDRCGAFREQLPRWLDEGLGTSAAADLSVHLAACAGCRAEADALKGTLQGLRAAAAQQVDAVQEAAGDAFTARVLASWARRRAQRPRRALAALGAAAAVLLVAGVGFRSWRHATTRGASRSSASDLAFWAAEDPLTTIECMNHDQLQRLDAALAAKGL